MNKLVRLFFLLPALAILIPKTDLFGSDVYGPRPFHQILDSDLNKTWSPDPVSAIQNREHVLLVDAGTMSYCLTVDPSDPSLLGVGDVSVLTGGTGEWWAILLYDTGRRPEADQEDVTA